MTSATETCLRHYLPNSDSALTHPGCPCGSGMRGGMAGWAQGTDWWLRIIQPIESLGDHVLTWGLKNTIITGFILRVQDLISDTEIGASSFEVFEARFIWLISCSCIQQILIEHLLCASAKDHKARPFVHCRPHHSGRQMDESHTEPCEVSKGKHSLLTRSLL